MTPEDESEGRSRHQYMKWPAVFIALVVGLLVGVVGPRCVPGPRPPDEKEASVASIEGHSVVSCSRWTAVFPGRASMERDYGRYPIADFHITHAAYVFPKRTTHLTVGGESVVVKSYSYSGTQARETLVRMLTSEMMDAPIVRQGYREWNSRKSVCIAVGDRYVTAWEVDKDGPRPTQLLTW